jgi:type I restriction enzyme S subunit
MKPGYKQTEVGVIPEEWEVKSLGEMANLYQPQTISAKEFSESGFPVYGANGVVGHYHKTNHNTWQVTVTCRGSTCGTVNRTIEHCWITGNAMVLNCDQNRDLDKAFFYYLLSAQNLSDCITGTGQPQIVRSPLASFYVPVPPLPEQRAIAGALSDVDALLGAQEALLAKKRDLKAAAMQQLLTGEKRLPGFTREWVVKRLGEVAEIKKGQLITSTTLIPGEIPVIAGGRQPAYFNAVANREGRTITISASGANAGYVAIYDGPIFASDCSTISESDSYCLEFVFYQLVSKQQTIYKAQTGGAQPHIHAKDLSPIPFSFPPLPEQTAIAAVLSDMDAEIAALEAQRDKTRALKQGMMQELLTGRIRLI